MTIIFTVPIENIVEPCCEFVGGNVLTAKNLDM